MYINHILITMRNLVVITQRVKEKADGLSKYTNYLLNNNTKSHKDTEIINLRPSINIDDILIKNISNVFELEYKNKKGGRKVESYGQSFVFTLPNGTPKPTKEQWIEVYKDIFKGIKGDFITKKPDGSEVKLTNDDFQEIFNSTVAVVHNQNNPHLNLIIPRIIKKKSTGEVVRLDGLDRQLLLISAKRSFTLSAINKLKFDFKNFKPDTTGLGRRRNKWIDDGVKAKKAAEAKQKKAAQIELEAAEMLQKATQAQLEAADMIKKAKEQEAVSKASLLDFKAYQNGFAELIRMIMSYISISKEAREIDRDEIEETYKIVSGYEFFDGMQQKLVEDSAKVVDASIKDEDEKITPIIMKIKPF